MASCSLLCSAFPDLLAPQRSSWQKPWFVWMLFCRRQECRCSGISMVCIDTRTTLCLMFTHNTSKLRKWPVEYRMHDKMEQPEKIGYQRQSHSLPSWMKPKTIFPCAKKDQMMSPPNHSPPTKTENVFSEQDIWTPATGQTPMTLYRPLDSSSMR